MYIPKVYKNENLDEVKNFIKQNSFGILVTHHNNKSHATHIPLELTTNSKEQEVLQAHISKANPQVEHFKNNQEVLCIFNGPHSYVSSSWYDYEEVPTWNYIAVHVYGTLKIIEGEELWDAMKFLMDKYESNSENPVKMENLSEKTLSQINGIIGFEIEINDIQAAYKLSQNKSDSNHANIISELNKSDNASAKAVANAMKNKITVTSS